MGPESFATALLNHLRIKPTRENIRAIVGWERAEGGHWNNDARYNPLNTTQPAPGAGNTGSQGNIKVYTSWDQGVRATAETLTNGRYGPILAALKQGRSAAAVADAIGQTPWGTSGDLVRRVVGATPAPKKVGPYSPGGSTTTTETTRTVPGVDNSAQRRALILQFAQQGAARNPMAVAALAQALPGAQDTPAKTTTTYSRSSTPSAGGSFAKGHSPLKELFYNGPGGRNVKDGQREPIGFVSGHTDHVHVAAGPKTVVELGQLAQRMGLHVGENPKFGGVHPVHVTGSYHYKGEAIDVSGTPEQMRRFNQTVAKLYKLA